jgi:hypothetical protein
MTESIYIKKALEAASRYVVFANFEVIRYDIRTHAKETINDFRHLISGERSNLEELSVSSVLHADPEIHKIFVGVQNQRKREAKFYLCDLNRRSYKMVLLKEEVYDLPSVCPLMDSRLISVNGFSKFDLYDTRSNRISKILYTDPEQERAFRLCS